MTLSALDRVRARAQGTATEAWLRNYYPDVVSHPMSRAHREFWRWIERIEPGAISTPFVALWPRGFGKSSSAELAVITLAARRARRYAVYVSGTQHLADTHVANIADRLGHEPFATDYPQLADRALTRFGQSRAYRRNRLITADGFVLDAAGLDSKVRGLVVDGQRPDLIILDDIDDESDSPEVMANKRDRLLRAIIPAKDMAAGTILAVQNVIYRGSVFDQIRERRLLSEAQLSGPYPALLDMVLRYGHDGTAIGVESWGMPFWDGMTVKDCQSLASEIGLGAFLAECQHDLQVMSDRVLPGFEPYVHAWPYDSLPDFEDVIGGLDAGGEGMTAHYTAGLVAGIFRFADDDEDMERLLVLSEFKERGEGVAHRQEAWMLAQEMLWKQKIRWREDGSQSEGIQYRSKRFHIIPSQRHRGSEEEQIKAIAELLAQTEPERVAEGGRPRLYYLRDSCQGFEDEALRWRRRPPKESGEGKREPVRVNDDLMAALRYLVEEYVEGERVREYTRGKVPRVHVRVG